MSTVVVIRQLMIFVILIGTGYLMYRKNILTDDTAKHISALITNLCNPLLVLSSCLNATEKIPHENLLMTFAVVGGIYAFFILCGFVVPPLLGIPKNERYAYHMMCVYGNTGFIGIPLVQALLGNSAVIYVTVFNVIYTLLIYTHGKWILLRGGSAAKLSAETASAARTASTAGTASAAGAPEKGALAGKRGRGFEVRDLMTPGFLLGVFTLIVYWFDWKFPAVITGAVTTIGNSTTFLSMAVLGVSLSAVSVLSLLKNIRLHVFIIVRFILIPAAIGLLLKAAGFNQVMVLVLTIISGMPVGNMTLMLSRELDLPTETFTYGIAWSTMLSVVTLTAVLAIVQ